MGAMRLMMLCLVVGACGDVVTDPPRPDMPVISGPPTVVSIVPADGAAGVAADASIVITFSERMDQAMTQAAYDSIDLPSSSVTMTWNGDGTVLTIDPNAPLTIAMGTDPTMVTAKTYTITLSTNAASAGGQKLAGPFTSSFRTLRRIQALLARNTTLSGTCFLNTNPSSGGRLIVGDSAVNTSYKGLVSYDLATLPAGIRSFDVATALFHFDGADNSPLPTLGPILVDHTTFTALTPACAAASRRALGTLPVASNTAVGVKMVDVKVAVAEDYMLGNATTQFRLTPSVVTDNDGVGDFLHFDTAPTAQLSLDYTVE